jgi:all-trans-retinol dehydrogenase (NAD+)
MASHREGPNIDIVARVVRKMALNEHLALPVAAAATYLSLDSSARHLVRVAEIASRLGLDPSMVTRAITCRAGRIALGLGAVGFALSFNDWLNKWCANNWTATKRGEWDWDREIVVVTGASSGVGASVVQKLLARNPRTTIVIIDFAPLSWTPPSDSKVHYYQADLSNSAVVKDVCERVRTEVGNPTVLVNNAGIARGYTVLDGSYADVELTLKTNLVAPFLLIKEFLPDMVKHNHGHIVSICSMSSVVAPPGIVDYAASKNGILSLHEVCDRPYYLEGEEANGRNRASKLSSSIATRHPGSASRMASSTSSRRRYSRVIRASPISWRLCYT